MKNLLITFIILSTCFFSIQITKAESTSIHKQNIGAWIDAKITKGMDSLNIAGATIIVVQNDSVLHVNGYGLADIESNTPVDFNSSIFGIGSISKTFVATAIMQLVENGKLKLDSDVNNYLTSFQLVYKFKAPITVKQLLMHTSGLDNRITGTSVHNEKDVIPLAQYLKDKKPNQIKPSGQVIGYSNVNYALLGLIIEEISGVPCYVYIRDKILKPLEMNSSGFKRRAELKDGYATSYWENGQQHVPYKPDFKLDYPAGGLNATALDMVNYISMFLNNGNYKDFQILDSASVAKMFHETFRHFPEAKCGRTLAFTESNWQGLKLYGHTGTVLGFNSQLTLIPEKNTGLFISINSGNHLTLKTKLFINQFIHEILAKLILEGMVDEEKAKGKPDIGSVDEPLEAFAGNYRYTQYGTSSIDKLGILISAPEIEIVQKENTLEIPQWNNKLFPISNLTFYSSYDSYLAFGKGVKGKISYFFAESDFHAESYVWNKLKWYEPIKFQKFWIGSIVLILLSYIIVAAVHKLFVHNKKSHLLKSINFSLSSLSVLFIVLLAYSLMTFNSMEFFFGIPLLIKIALVIPFIIIPLVLLGIYLLIKAIRLKELKAFNLIYQALVLVATLLFIPWLMYYNLIWVNF